MPNQSLGTQQTEKIVKRVGSMQQGKTAIFHHLGTKTETLELAEGGRSHDFRLKRFPACGFGYTPCLCTPYTSLLGEYINMGL